MSEIPDEAVTAAAAVHDQAINDLLGRKKTAETEAHIARVMLEAAAPLIAAAERERIIAIAVDHGAVYADDNGEDHPFDELLKDVP